MSMPIIQQPENPIDREQAINDIIESVALIETGLSHVINAEGEKIQKVVNSDNPVIIDDIIRVNDSASKMINTVSKLEMMLQSKLNTTNDLSNNSGFSLDNEIIIPYSTTNIYISTTADGKPYDCVCAGFASYADGDILMKGNEKVINIESEWRVIDRVSFSMPKDGVITGISAFYSTEPYNIPKIDLQVIARIYVAKRGSNTYYATDAILNLEPKIPALINTFINIDGIRNDLNVELKAMDKVLFVFYLTHNDETQIEDYINGSGGGSIIIKTGK